MQIFILRNTLTFAKALSIALLSPSTSLAIICWSFFKDPTTKKKKEVIQINASGLNFDEGGKQQ